MADIRKNNTLVVVVVLLGYLTMPALCFTSDIQEYTDAFSRRSFAIMDGMMDQEGVFMKLGYPVFVIITFCSALRSLIALLAGCLPNLLGYGGPLGMLMGFPTEMAQARDGTNRDQRLLDYVEDKVRSSVTAGQSEFENEVKKKRK